MKTLYAATIDLEVLLIFETFYFETREEQIHFAQIAAEEYGHEAVTLSTDSSVHSASEALKIIEDAIDERAKLAKRHSFGREGFE